MYRHADGARLVRNGTRDRLPDPPCRIGREFIAFGIVEFIDRFQKAQISFLNEIQKLQPAPQIFFCNGDHETEIPIRKLFLRIPRCFLFFRSCIRAHPRLDPLSEYDFFFTGQKGQRTDFLQIHFHGIIDGDGIVQIGHRGVFFRFFLGFFRFFDKLSRLLFIYEVEGIIHFFIKVDFQLVDVKRFIKCRQIFLPQIVRGNELHDVLIRHQPVMGFFLQLLNPFFKLSHSFSHFYIPRYW